MHRVPFMASIFNAKHFQPRGYNILGPGDFSRSDQMWFFTLSYANGPGYNDHVNPDGGRQSPRGKKYLDPQFRQPTTVPESEETHAGEDVGVYANGPYAHVSIQNKIMKVKLIEFCSFSLEFMSRATYHMPWLLQLAWARKNTSKMSIARMLQ